MSDNSNSFVRHEMLAERAPPAGEGGILKWVRENLFSSVF
jgi:general L-amino acid transport system permease protein